jgi:hypothetical protein
MTFLFALRTNPLFASPPLHVEDIVETEKGVECVLSEAVRAFRRGTRRMHLQGDAVEALRRQFAARVQAAVAQPDWPEKWQDEEPYVRGFATEMGRRAARLARDDVRTVINQRDVDEAVWKLRGHLPVAGRWCPV